MDNAPALEIPGLGISIPALRAAGGIMLLTLVSMLLAGRLQQLLGVTGMHVIDRVMGVIPSALAAKFIFDGIRQGGLLAT